MRIYHNIAGIREFVRQARSDGRSIGFVPTMGCLHEGHLELMRRARERCGAVVVSIFVNPAQFGPNEDFASYPRDLERDAAMAAGVKADAIFNPSVEEMYPPGACTFVDLERITEKLCGLSRPGHFRGVATVVTKLFNIVRPDTAFFGQKDAQQALVIRRMVRDLDLNIEIVTVPTVREADGLAMSSRNVYLRPEERRAALVLSRSLSEAQKAVQAGERDAAAIRRRVAEILDSEPLAETEYAEIYSFPDLEPVTNLQGPALLALAVKIGPTRMIDNTVLEV